MTDEETPDPPMEPDEYAEEMVQAMAEAAMLVDRHNEWARDEVGPSATIKSRYVGQFALALFQARTMNAAPGHGGDGRLGFQ